MHGLSVNKTVRYSLNLMRDLVHIDAAVVGFLLIVAVSALNTFMNTSKRVFWPITKNTSLLNHTNISLLKVSLIFDCNHNKSYAYVRPHLSPNCNHKSMHKRKKTLAWTERTIHAQIWRKITYSIEQDAVFFILFRIQHVITIKRERFI